jgi:hypothetical protein
MADKKETTKNTTKKKSTTTKAKTTTTKKKAEPIAEKKIPKVEEVKQPMTINDIPPELMKQMFEMFQSMQQQTQVKTVKNEPIEIEEEKPKKITKAYLRKIKDKEITVRSVAGVVSFKSPKTNTRYKWVDIGDEEVLTIDEILTMDSTSRRFLNTPWLMIDDKDVIEGLGLTDLYNTIEKIENVDELLDMTVGEIEELVNKTPNDYKRNLSGVIFQKVNGGELRDIVLIRELERILGVTLML